MNVKHISELENGLIKQVVSERRGLIIRITMLSVWEYHVVCLYHHVCVSV